MALLSLYMAHIWPMHGLYFDDDDGDGDDDDDDDENYRRKEMIIARPY